MMADHYWMLERDAPQKKNMKTKMPLRRSFECKRVCYNEKKLFFSCRTREKKFDLVRSG